MSDDLIFEVSGYQKTPLTLLARVCAEDATGSASPVTKEGSLVKQADVSGIAVKSFAVSDGAQNGSTQSPTASTVISDTLQTSGIWGNLPRGGNAKYTAPATFFPDAVQTKVEMTVTLTGGTVGRVVWLVDVQPILS